MLAWKYIHLKKIIKILVLVTAVYFSVCFMVLEKIQLPPDELMETTSTSVSPRIPHIIHYHWDSLMVPNVFKTWIQSWVKHHPHWQFWWWTPTAVKTLLRLYYPDYLTLYESYTDMTKKSNFMRYFIMQRYGGVYIDLDMECLKNIDEWTYKYYCFLSEETYEHAYILYKRALAEVMNTIMACRPAHPMYDMCIEELPLHAKIESTLHSTGVFFLDQIFNKYNLSTRRYNNMLNLSDPDVILAVEPDYFLPIYDKGQDFRLPCKIYGTPSNIYGPKEKWMCDDLKKRKFKSIMKNVSFAHHHWFHVGAKKGEWKRNTDQFDIRDIISNVSIVFANSSKS